MPSVAQTAMFSGGLIAQVQSGLVSVETLNRLGQSSNARGGIELRPGGRRAEHDFTPIHTTAKVIRTAPLTGTAGYLIATQYVELSPDHHEHIIRHITQTQAERLRARREGNA